MKKVNLILFVFCTICFVSCAKKQYSYTVKSIEGIRVEMDSTWDAKANPEMVELVNSYKTKLENQMNEEIGTAARNMIKGFPQSLLSNFTADAMKEYGEEKWRDVDFAVMNNGGIRTTLNKGTITVGNIFEIYPFENEVVLLELPGQAVIELFRYFAVNGGEGMSDGIRFNIKNKKIDSLLIGGKPVDKNKTYRVVTIDYLAEGNSNMTAFLQRTAYLDSHEKLRDVMIQMIKEKTAKGELIDSKLDDRISRD